jgi:putative nucleotidyltransferase with HDIG domain
MTGTAISRDAAARLASYIEDRRHDIVASVVRSSVLPRPGSPAASAFANAFLDRLCQELEVSDRDIVDVWADTVARPEEAFEHARIVVIGCAVISSAYVADCGRADDIVSFLALRSSELEKRFRTEPSERDDRSNPASRLVDRDEVVSSLLAAIEARDPATCEHSRAVGMWCGRIAKTIGLGSKDQAAAALAGTLHDVGKIATPTEILLKAGPLESEEWEAMRAHAQIGAKMLERIASLRDVAYIVRAHHERMDGTGYPDGLSGSSIPLLARVVSVADSFHAMISKRPYREALGVPYALDELRAGVGTQWDGTVVNAMFDIVQPRGVVRELRAVRGAGG